MKLKKTRYPLNMAVLSIGMVFCLFSLFSVLTAILWSIGLDCALWTLTGFAVPVILLLGYALYCLRCNAKSMVRDRLKIWSFVMFVPAVLIYVGLELFSGYMVNTANIKRKRLNELYQLSLDDEKLCARLLAGEDPTVEPYKSGSAKEIFKTGSVPQFKGVYSGDFMSSFGDGGKIYMRLGRYAADEMIKAAEKRDSAEFVRHTENMIRVLVKATKCLRDPENSAVVLGREFVDVLQKSVTANFPDREGLLTCNRALSFLRENFEANMFNYVIYDTQAVLSSYDALLKDPSRINRMVNSNLNPLWSDIDLFAARVFPAARRNRLAMDYGAAVDFLNVYRNMAANVFSPISNRIKSYSEQWNKLSSKRCKIALALIPDMRSNLYSIGEVQHKIETAHIAMETEYFRREKKHLPEKLDDIQNSRLMYVPNGHIDGTAYSIVKGKFKDKSGKEFSGYALSVPTGSFVITDK